jgi:hypothetical protein
VGPQVWETPGFYFKITVASEWRMV